MDAFEERKTIHPWHLDVADDGVVIHLGNTFQGRGRGFACIRLDMAHAELDSFGQRSQQRSVVVNNQDARICHSTSSLGTSSGRPTGKRITKLAPVPGSFSTVMLPW